MLRFLGFVFLLLLSVSAWGKYAGWFDFSYTGSSSESDGRSSFTVDFHKSEFDRDVASYREQVHAAIEVMDAKLHALRSRSQNASAKSKQEIDQEIRDLEQTKSAASESLNDLEHSEEEQREASRKKLDQVLQEHGTSATGHRR